MSQTIIQHGGRFALWSSVVEDAVTPATSEAEIRILCAAEGWSAHAIEEGVARAKDVGISSRMHGSLDQMIRGRIGIVEDVNADRDEGEDPLPVPTREEMLARYFVEDGHRESSIHTTEDGLDLIVRTAERGGGDARDVLLGLRDGEIVLVNKDDGQAQGLTIDAAAIDALVCALGRLRPAIQQGEAVRSAFLRLVDDDVAARISSDVDGMKGTFALVDGAVVRVLGAGMTVPFEGTVDDILKIGDDGAYAVERAG